MNLSIQNWPYHKLHVACVLLKQVSNKRVVIRGPIGSQFHGLKNVVTRAWSMINKAKKCSWSDFEPLWPSPFIFACRPVLARYGSYAQMYACPNSLSLSLKTGDRSNGRSFCQTWVGWAEDMGTASPPYVSKLDFPGSEIGLLLICLYCFQADQAFSERGIPMADDRPLQSKEHLAMTQDSRTFHVTSFAIKPPF